MRIVEEQVKCSITTHNIRKLFNENTTRTHDYNNNNNRGDMCEGWSGCM